MATSFRPRRGSLSRLRRQPPYLRGGHSPLSRGVTRARSGTTPRRRWATTPITSPQDHGLVSGFAIRLRNGAMITQHGRLRGNSTSLGIRWLDVDGASQCWTFALPRKTKLHGRGMCEERTGEERGMRNEERKRKTAIERTKRHARRLQLLCRRETTLGRGTQELPLRSHVRRQIDCLTLDDTAVTRQP